MKYNINKYYKKEKIMIITWMGSLVMCLSKLCEKPFKEENVKNCSEDRIKRIGIYLMCIDDLFS